MTAAASSTDVVTAIVAGYAAAVATGALAFQVFSWSRTWRTRVRVRLHNDRSIASAGEPPVRVLLFDLANRSAHAVKVTHLSLRLSRRRRGNHIFLPWPRGLLRGGPFEIPARDTVAVWMLPSDLDESIRPGQAIRAIVSTADGRTFKSNRVRFEFPDAA